ncbi:MAG TPA: WG repeat-containing protein [Achromobacter sp.]|nr:WG repeat-containing protein [Achromobacter sp.]
MRAAIKPLTLALAFALPSLASTAHADSWISRCTASYYGQGSDTYCHQAYSEGLAAVLTGSADDPAGVWGYLDKQGRMAITPAYAEASPFQNGLAAVSQDGLWGYIDTRGQWVIKPRFGSASGFNAEGTALAEEDERDVLIDRQGKVIKTFELGTRTWGFRPGQKLASIEVPTPPRLFNIATAKAASLPAGVMALAAPTEGYLPAQLRESRYNGWWGLLDDNGRWALSPDVLRSQAAPIRDGGVLAVRRDEKWQFVDPRGAALSPARYERVQRVAAGLWLVTPEDGKAALLDAKLQTLHTFSNAYVGLQERDGWRYLPDVSMTLLISPAGTLEQLALDHGRVEINQGRAWVYGVRASSPGAADAGATDDATRATGLMDAAKEGTPAEADPGEAVDAAGIAVDAGAPADAVPAAAAADTAATVMTDVAAPPTAVDSAQAASDPNADTAAATDVTVSAVLADGDSQTTSMAPPGVEALIQIYAEDGKPLLDADTVARLRAYEITAFSPGKTAGRSGAAAGMPLALLRTGDYQQPPSILTASGTVVSNPEWEAIDAYDATMPLVVRTSGGKFGAIDGKGAWAVPPKYSGIRKFSGAYTWARTSDMSRDDALLIDVRGKTVPIPDDVAADATHLDGDLLLYRAPDENRARRWGIWNIRRGAPALKPVYEHIEEFEDDWARVQDKDHWGVVNRDGQWVVRPTHESAYKMEYLGDGFMLVDDPDAKDTANRYADSPYRLVNLRTGKASATVYGKPAKIKDGRYIGELADGSPVLFDGQGHATRLSQGKPESREQYGDWVIMRNDEREGAIDARGNFAVPALYGEFNPFFVQPEGLARVNLGAGYRLIDQSGKTVLEKRGDGFPLASMQRLLFTDASESSAIMTDLQGREITRFPGRYSVEYNGASEGVAPYSDESGRSGFVNADGKRVVGAHFSQLGPMKDGLARARRLERTGKLYGFIDLTGRYAIPPAFKWADDFHDGRAMVLRDGGVEFIDTHGKMTALFGVLCDTVVIFDAEENLTWPKEALTCPEATQVPPPVLDNAKAE